MTWCKCVVESLGGDLFWLIHSTYCEVDNFNRNYWGFAMFVLIILQIFDGKIKNWKSYVDDSRTTAKSRQLNCRNNKTSLKTESYKKVVNSPPYFRLLRANKRTWSSSLSSILSVHCLSHLCNLFCDLHWFSFLNFFPFST